MLTYKVTNQSAVSRPSHPRSSCLPPRSVGRPSSPVKEKRQCYYCHKLEHIVTNCLALKRKQHSNSASLGAPSKGIGLIGEIPAETYSVPRDHGLDPCFQPFIVDGVVSLPGNPDEIRSVRILRDTGTSQTVILSSVLPFSDKSACCYNVVLSGIEMGYDPRPLLDVRINCQLARGVFHVTVCLVLPISGVTMLLGMISLGVESFPPFPLIESFPHLKF